MASDCRTKMDLGLVRYHSIHNEMTRNTRTFLKFCPKYQKHSLLHNVLWWWLIAFRLNILHHLP